MYRIYNVNLSYIYMYVNLYFLCKPLYKTIYTYSVTPALMVRKASVKAMDRGTSLICLKMVKSAECPTVPCASVRKW